MPRSVRVAVHRRGARLDKGSSRTRKPRGSADVEFPTIEQVKAARAVVAWYLELYHGGGDDPGLLSMFYDARKVGAFAVSSSELRRGDADALFRMLVATTMFQRRQDVQILRILRGITKSEVADLTRPKRLLALVDASPCNNMKTTTALHEACDLAKHAVTRKGRCGANPKVDCHLKRHTVVLRRYGHFGKVPTSAALMLREAGVPSLRALRTKVLRATNDPKERARLLEEHLSRAWRISDKIASMFLSALSAPDMSTHAPPWMRGVDWTLFVVVDSNVDLFLAAVGYAGSRSYAARREFIRKVAARIDLSKLRRDLTPFNPRLVQQAMYLFMSATNRRAIERDCTHLGEAACRRCPNAVARLCPVRRS
jgi:hypothetical protein